MVAIAQETIGAVAAGVAGSITLPGAPTEGRRLILVGWARNAGTVAVPTGFTELVTEAITGLSSAIMLATRIVEAGDDDEYDLGTVSSVNRCYWLAELDTAGSLGDVDSGVVTGDTTPGPAAPASGGFVIGGFAVMSDISGRRVTIESPSTEVRSEIGVDGGSGGFGPKASLGYGTDEIYAEATADAAAYHFTGWVAVSVNEGAVEPSEPPAYEPPLPAGPILEIYTADPDGAKWDVAVWGTDVWAASGWQDITPEGVVAEISTGTEDVAMGILAKPDAATWTVTTYDPDRRLDPANDASPFVGYLRPGLPIRISHAGVVLRTGELTRLAYSYARETGALAATDTIAKLARARVPESALAGLASTLWARVTDVIDAANVAVSIRRGRPEYDIPLSDPPEGERSAWDHIWLASQEVLAIPWVWPDGRLGWQWYAAPLQRGTVLSAANLVDVTTIADGRGLYSTIRTVTDAPPATEELSATPTPAYGERLYERTVSTIDAADWVAAVLADRSEGGLRFVPGELVAFTAADVAQYAGIRIGELVTLSTPDLAVSGIVLGIRLRVAYDQSGAADGEPPDWRFTFHMARTDSTVLVADFTGDPLVSDADATEFLTEG